jgi:hypothetical protein
MMPHACQIGTGKKGDEKGGNMGGEGWEYGMKIEGGEKCVRTNRRE